MTEKWAYQDEADEFDRTEHLPSEMTGAVEDLVESLQKSLQAARVLKRSLGTRGQDAR